MKKQDVFRKALMMMNIMYDKIKDNEESSELMYCNAPHSGNGAGSRQTNTMMTMILSPKGQTDSISAFSLLMTSGTY